MHSFVSLFVMYKLQITNLLPENEHGFFILEYGRQRCNKLGGFHFNPTNSNHGKAQSCNRHHGDLEPITADEYGNARFYEQWDPRVQLQVQKCDMVTRYN